MQWIKENDLAIITSERAYIRDVTVRSGKIYDPEWNEK